MPTASYFSGYNESVVTNDTPAIETIDIAGATWEFTDDWDCHGSELEIIRNVSIWGREGAIEDRRLCAARCLEYQECESFNYPKYVNLCVLKYNLKKSKIRGWNCGAENTKWQFYTLLKRNGKFRGDQMLNVVISYQTVS